MALPVRLTLKGRKTEAALGGRFGQAGHVDAGLVRQPPGRRKGRSGQ
ncbi:hypothetical protein [Symbioplanes lichenis]|nr:hypothetical protein [Actinoplanes lichenis]